MLDPYNYHVSPQTLLGGKEWEMRVGWMDRLNGAITGCVEDANHRDVDDLPFEITVRLSVFNKKTLDLQKLVEDDYEHYTDIASFKCSGSDIHCYDRDYQYISDISLRLDDDQFYRAVNDLLIKLDVI